MPDHIPPSAADGAAPAPLARAIDDAFAQRGYPVRLEWGRRGALAAAERGDVLVIVDVLSFSTSVATAIDRGGAIRPCADQPEAERVARELGAMAALPRSRVPAEGRFSLSPLTFLELEPGTTVTLASPNGATCTRLAGAVPAIFAGALVNASAVGRAARAAMARAGCGLTVVPCGERWTGPPEEEDLRFAIEDYLGAGAVLAAIDAETSPEAGLCRATFLAARATLGAMIRECASGLELRLKGYPDDVDHAARHDLYDTVPAMHGEIFRAPHHDAGHHG